jgi:hypothetical protein
LTFWTFLPHRGVRRLCPACSGLCRLPMNAALPGVLVYVGVMALEMGIAKAAGAHQPDSLPGLLGVVALGAFIFGSSAFAGCLVCKVLTTRLDRA